MTAIAGRHICQVSDFAKVRVNQRVICLGERAHALRPDSVLEERIGRPAVSTARRPGFRNDVERLKLLARRRNRRNGSRRISQTLTGKHQPDGSE